MEHRFPRLHALVNWSFPRNRNKLPLLVLSGVVVIAVTGCGPKRLRADFTGYESSYAETSNREMLMNLARLENREPTYFFKIGTIQSTYKMAAALPTTALRDPGHDSRRNNADWWRQPERQLRK